jgi:hypothetical protein
MYEKDKIKTRQKHVCFLSTRRINRRAFEKYLFNYFKQDGYGSSIRRRVSIQR